LDIRAEITNEDFELRHLVCSVFIRALETLPALVRQWWTALDKRSSDVVRTRALLACALSALFCWVSVIFLSLLPG